MRTIEQSPRETAFVQDPYPFYAEARREGPFFHWADYGFACSTNYTVTNLLLRDRRFGRMSPDQSEIAYPGHLAAFSDLERHSMLNLDGKPHQALRTPVMRAFTSRQIGTMAPEIRQICAELIRDFPSGEFDFLATFAEQLPVRVIAQLIGVPPEQCDDLLRWSHAMVAMYQARKDWEIEDRAEAAARDFSACLTDLIAERQKTPRNDLISRLCAEGVDGMDLTLAAQIGTCVLLLNAGHEATVHVIGNGLKAFVENGLDLATSARETETIPPLVEEMLRFDAPLHLFTRYAQCDVEVAGQSFRRGDCIGCLLGAANRDPAVFAQPDRFVADRPNASANLSFGAGAHFCIGAPLARLELTIAFEELAKQCPGLAISAQPRYRDSYHFHGLERLDVRIA